MQLKMSKMELLCKLTADRVGLDSSPYVSQDAFKASEKPRRDHFQAIVKPTKRLSIKEVVRK